MINKNCSDMVFQPEIFECFVELPCFLFSELLKLHSHMRDSVRVIFQKHLPITTFHIIPCHARTKLQNRGVASLQVEVRPSWTSLLLAGSAVFAVWIVWIPGGRHHYRLPAFCTRSPFSNEEVSRAQFGTAAITPKIDVHEFAHH